MKKGDKYPWEDEVNRFVRTMEKSRQTALVLIDEEDGFFATAAIGKIQSQAFLCIGILIGMWNRLDVEDWVTIKAIIDKLQRIKKMEELNGGAY